MRRWGRPGNQSKSVAQKLHLQASETRIKGSQLTNREVERLLPNLEIKQLHRDLLRYSEKDERRRDEYKSVRNDKWWVSSSRRIRLLPPH